MHSGMDTKSKSPWVRQASIDKMQMLALRCGYRAIVSERKDGQHVLYLTRGRWLTLRGTNGTHEPLGREHYQGIVWCPSVRTGFWLARRRGRPFITGNTWPQKLVQRMILAGTSERGVCPECGAPWVREMERVDTGERQKMADGWDTGAGAHGTIHRDGREQGEAGIPVLRKETRGWRPNCDPDCVNGGKFRTQNPAVVLDPFGGSGTTALVARKLGRKAILIELNSEYCALAAERLAQQSLFATEEVS